MASGSRFDSEVLTIRDELIRLAEKIAARYASGRCLSGRKVISLLMEYLCERCIIEKVRQGYDEDDEIDRVWRNLHEYAVSRLVERLKNELVAKGFPISIFSEADNPTGRYDVLLMVDGRGIQILNSGGNISLEAKTGLNISLNQSEKYMWNGTTVILVRFASGDVIVLRAADWASFLKAALTDRTEKAKRILDGKVILVPGRDCYECPAESCRFKKCGREREPTKPRSMDELFDSFRRNAYSAIDEAVRAVTVELNWILEGEISRAHEKHKSLRGDQS